MPPRRRAALVLLALTGLSCSPIARGGERCKGGLADEGLVCESGTECLVTGCGRGGCVSYCARPCELGCPTRCGCEGLDGGLESPRPVCTRDGLICA